MKSTKRIHFHFKCPISSSQSSKAIPRIVGNVKRLTIFSDCTLESKAKIQIVKDKKRELFPLLNSAKIGMWSANEFDFPFSCDPMSSERAWLTVNFPEPVEDESGILIHFDVLLDFELESDSVIGRDFFNTF